MFFVIFISIFLILFTIILNKKEYSYSKESIIECGFESFEDNPGIRNNIDLESYLNEFKSIFDLKKYNLMKYNVERNKNLFEDKIKEKYYIKFFIIAILFLIFDLEILLLFPIILVKMTTKNFIFMLLSIYIIILGLYYEFYNNFL